MLWFEGGLQETREGKRSEGEKDRLGAKDVKRWVYLKEELGNDISGGDLAKGQQDFKGWGQ